MKASERLRELDEATKDLLPTLNYYIGPGARTAVSRESVQMYYATKAARNALPLIADVVEAAEWALHTDVWIDDNPFHGPTLARGGGTTKTQTWDNLHVALTALRDALQPEGDRT